MKNAKSQKGFGHVLLLLLLVVVVAVGAVAYRVVKNQNTVSLSNETTSTTVNKVPEIHSAADLQKAETSVSNENIDGDLNPDQLNDDIDSLL